MDEKVATLSGKNTPRPSFPEMRCPIYKQPIMLVCPKPDKDHKLFLCAKYLSEHLDEVNSWKENLITFDDFVREISQKSGLDFQASEEAMNLVKQRSSNENHFGHHVNEQKALVSQVIDNLQGLYSEKCKELVSTLQDVLEKEKNILSNNFGKFEHEVKTDKERDVEYPKFHEVKEKIQGMTDLTEIEEYMRDVMRKQQSWKDASVELRTLGKRSEDFYREQVENHLNSKPQFSSADQIIQTWTKGLDSLICQVKRQASCFTGLYSSSDGIPLNIISSQELNLVTKDMIKDDTQICVNFGKKKDLDFSKQKVDLNEATKIGVALGNLTNIAYLKINLEDSIITTDGIREMLQGLKNLNDLKVLEINIYGNKLKNGAVKEIADAIGDLKNLLTLRLFCGINELTCDGAKDLANSISQLTNLNHLILDLKYNKIKELGAQAIGSCLEKLTELRSLNLNLGGYSMSKNAIKETGATNIARALRNLTKLTQLNLDLGHTGLQDGSMMELSMSLRQLHNLNKVDLGFYTNGITEKGGNKFAKALSKMPAISHVSLNLNNNTLKKEGSTEVVNAFRRMDKLTNLDLFLRNVGLNKGEGTSFKTDLSVGKMGQPFENLDLHI